VLILRDRSLCGEIAALFPSGDPKLVFLPVTRTEFLQPRSFSLFQYSWIAFTSANGVRGLFRALGSEAYVLPPNVKIAAVGNSTAKAVYEVFSRNADIVSDVADGVHLARTLIVSLPAGTEILYPCPGGHDSEFMTLCNEYGLKLQPLPVYLTVPAETSEIREKFAAFAPVKVAVFYAPSAVRVFHEACPTPWDFTAIAIGPSTFRALAELDHSKTIESENPDPASLAKAIRVVSSLKGESQYA